MTSQLDAGSIPETPLETHGLDLIQEASPDTGASGADVAIEVEDEAGLAPPLEGSGDLDRRVQLARRLAVTRVTVDRVLETVSESRLEARRLVTKELWVDPRPEILNTIVKIACDPAKDGLRRELPRHLLTVHTLIEVELAGLLDAPEIDQEAIRESCEILPELRDLARQIQDEITGTLDDATSEAKDYLLQVCNSLDVAEETLSTATLLASRLVALAKTAVSGSLREAWPGLDEDEFRLLDRLFGSGCTENAPGRNCLNAIALRSLMLDDLECWHQACAGVTGIDESVDVDPKLLRRMNREKTAFHLISDRLQATQDSALLAGLHGFADEVRGFRQSLFSTYLEFTPALRDASRGKASAKVPHDDSALLSLIERTVAADDAADAARANATSKEELYLKALTDMRRDAPEQPDTIISASAAEVRSSKHRLRWLVGIAAVLSTVVAALYVPLLFAPQASHLPTPADFSSAVALTEMVSAGGMMYARVSQWSWEDLSPADRLSKVEELGRIAESKKMNGVMLADEAGRELAHWNRTDGATLVPSPDP